MLQRKIWKRGVRRAAALGLAVLVAGTSIGLDTFPSVADTIQEEVTPIREEGVVSSISEESSTENALVRDSESADEKAAATVEKIQSEAAAEADKEETGKNDTAVSGRSGGADGKDRSISDMDAVESIEALESGNPEDGKAANGQETLPEEQDAADENAMDEATENAVGG